MLDVTMHHFNLAMVTRAIGHPYTFLPPSSGSERKKSKKKSKTQKKKERWGGVEGLAQAKKWTVSHLSTLYKPGRPCQIVQ